MLIEKHINAVINIYIIIMVSISNLTKYNIATFLLGRRQIHYYIGFMNLYNLQMQNSNPEINGHNKNKYLKNCKCTYINGLFEQSFLFN